MFIRSKVTAEEGSLSARTKYGGVKRIRQQTACLPHTHTHKHVKQFSVSHDQRGDIASRSSDMGGLDREESPWIHEAAGTTNTVTHMSSPGHAILASGAPKNLTRHQISPKGRRRSNVENLNELIQMNIDVSNTFWLQRAVKFDRCDLSCEDDIMIICNRCDSLKKTVGFSGHFFCFGVLCIFW